MWHGREHDFDNLSTANRIGDTLSHQHNVLTDTRKEDQGSSLFQYQGDKELTNFDISIESTWTT